MKRVLVTGGTGFVGANLTRRLLADGHAVHLVVRPDHQRWRLDDVTNDLRWHTHDVCDAEPLRRTLSEARPDWIFHLAAHGAYPHQQSVDSIVRTNAVGTAVLTEAAVRQGFDAFVHTGTSSEYGFRDSPSREGDRIEPNSVYAAAKAAATLLCGHFGRSTGRRIVTLRLYSVYGPFEEPSRLMPRLVVNASKNRLPALARPGTARDFVYVDDVVGAMIAAATARELAPGGIFNVCSGTQTSLAELVDICRTEFGVTAAARWESLPARSWDTSCWIGDPAKTAAELGWRASTGVRQGLRAFAAWLNRHSEWRPRYAAAANDEAPT